MNRPICLLLIAALAGCSADRTNGVTIPPKKLAPVPETAPIAAPGLVVMIIENELDRSKLPDAQKTIFISAKLREFLRTNGLQSPDGNFRIFDRSEDLSDVPLWKTGRDYWESKSIPTPAIVISNGKTGGAFPLPDTVDATIDLIRKFSR